MAIYPWRFLRALRWLAWIGFFVWSAYFAWDRVPHLNSFGQLKLHAEAWFFGLANLAVFAGFLEMMLRERAGIPRPGKSIERIPAR
jgi:hypothetical protein